MQRIQNSHILRRAVRYCVMLPPDYGHDANKQFPILYFLHGLGENEQALLSSGGWELIQDQQRDHKVGDFVMVAPDGGGSCFINSADGKKAIAIFFWQNFCPSSKLTIACSARGNREG